MLQSVKFSISKSIFSEDATFMKWSVAPVVSGVRVRPGPEQERDDLGVAEGARVVEGDEAAVVAGVDIGPGVQQNLHGFPPPITWHRKLYVRRSVRGPLFPGGTPTQSATFNINILPRSLHAHSQH